MTDTPENSHEYRAARTAPAFCQSCGRERRPDWLKCACGCTVWGPEVRGDANPGPELVGDGRVWGLLGHVIETLPIGDLCLVYGQKGVGKSTLAFRAFTPPHDDQLPGVYIVSREMKPRRVLQYCRRLGVRPDRVLYPPPAVPGEPLPPLDLPDDAHSVVYDSISMDGNGVERLAELEAHRDRVGARVLLISHVTKDGKAAGRESLSHAVDSVIRLDYAGGMRRITVQKHREGTIRAESVLFRFDGAGVPVLPQWDRYYSVEGQPPNYHLSPWPDGKARRYGAALVAAAAGKLAGPLPSPPVAVSTVYAGALGGWVEPQDGDERRRFALAHGCPYLDARGELHHPEAATTRVDPIALLPEED